MPISNSTPITPADASRNAGRPSGNPDGGPIPAWRQATSPLPATRSTSRDGVQRAPGLRQMEPVVPGDHPEKQVEALRAAFGVDPEAGAILLGGSRPERDVRLPERLEEREEL